MKKVNTQEQLSGEYDNQINKFNKDGLTALHVAIKKSDITKIKELIEKGLYINIRAEYNYSPIEFACMNNKVAEAEILLENGVNIENQDLLHIVCSLGNIEMVKLLIKYGCNVNEIDFDGRVPAHLAIKENHLECLKILYSNNANFDIRSYKNSTILSYAVGEGKLEIVKYLLKIGMSKYINDKVQPPLSLAVHWKYINIIELLIENNADINLKDGLGNTPLIDTIINGNYQITKILLKHKANPYIKSKNGQNSVTLLKRKHKQIQELLKIIEE